MEIYWILLICLAAVVLFILVFFAIVSVLIQKTRFGVRSDGNPALRYFQAKDFENLQAEDISFVSDKGQTLRGCIYSDMRVKELNMLCHTIAAHFRTDPIHTRELRAYAVDEVKRTNGQVSFENAVRSQRRIEPDDAWPGSY